MLFLIDICTDQDMQKILGWVKNFLTLIQIAIPIALIIWGTIDLGKAVIASKEDEIKKAQQTLIKRAMAAVLVFVLATLVSFLMRIVGGDQWRACWDSNTAGSCPGNQVINGTTGLCECPAGTNWSPTDRTCK